MELDGKKKLIFMFVISDTALLIFRVLRTFFNNKTSDQVSLFPVWRQNPLGLVITSQAMDPALDKDEPEFGVLIL